MIISTDPAVTRLESFLENMRVQTEAVLPHPRHLATWRTGDMARQAENFPEGIQGMEAEESEGEADAEDAEVDLLLHPGSDEEEVSDRDVVSSEELSSEELSNEEEEDG